MNIWFLHSGVFYQQPLAVLHPFCIIKLFTNILCYIMLIDDRKKCRNHRNILLRWHCDIVTCSQLTIVHHGSFPIHSIISIGYFWNLWDCYMKCCWVLDPAPASLLRMFSIAKDILQPDHSNTGVSSLLHQLCCLASVSVTSLDWAATALPALTDLSRLGVTAALCSTSLSI